MSAETAGGSGTVATGAQAALAEELVKYNLQSSDVAQILLTDLWRSLRVQEFPKNLVT
jgi:hypothetical protein